jgi:MoxR-like ATPase
MSFQLFRGQGQIQPIDLDQRLPVIDRASQRSAANYLADEGLRQAVDVAVYLGMPLLLTGEPGTGKTQLASRVAAEFSLEEPLVFETKSSSVAQDLFYSFDAVSRFALSQVRPAGDDSQARAQHAAALDPRRFVRYQALGLAILRANEIDVARQWLPAEHDFKGYVPRRSVVLIDEIDKAPRDFPNDLLNEIDRKRFRVPEIGDGHLETPDNRAPIVIITSNSERQLPDAFLRRCVYHHIDPPDDDRLIDIVCLRLPQFRAGPALLNDAISFFQSLRSEGAGLGKKPSTAELLIWLEMMLGLGADVGQPLAAQYTVANAALLKTLAKNPPDCEAMRQQLAARCGIDLSAAP